MSRSLLAGVALVLAAAALPARAVPAQSIWSSSAAHGSARIDVLKPDFTDDEFSATTLIYVATASFILSDRLVLDVDLPFVHAVRQGFVDRRSQVVGNPYIGVRIGSRPPPVAVYGEIGVRPPLASVSGDDDFAVGVGMLGDFDRFEAYVPDELSVSAMLNIDGRNAAGLGGRFRVGLVRTMSTETGAVETVLGYGAQLRTDVERLRLGAAFTGRTLLEDQGLFGDGTVHHLGASAGLAFGRLRPTLALRVPVDSDFRNLVRSILGLSLEYEFR